MSVYIENETDSGFDFEYEEVITRVVAEALKYVKCPYDAEVNVMITDLEGIRSVNKEYRGIDAPTDVLSFPAAEYDNPGDFSGIDRDMIDYFNPDSGELMLGDIMLCRDKITSQAKEYGHGELRELAFLTAHSMFHLFGYDHMEEDERMEMEKMQEEVLSNLNITRNTGLNERLIERATAAKEYSYSPYSHFRVGAAILTGSGEIYDGCNIENSSYGLTICAERTAAVKAVSSEKNVYFKAIAIVSDCKRGFTYPCGACRQFLAEFSDENTEFVLYDEEQHLVKVFSFEEMFPNAFTLEKG